MGGYVDEDAPPAKKSRVDKKTVYNGPAFELKCINTIRALSADMPSAAKSGHPGAPMGCAPMAHLLWSEVMKYSPSKPDWWNRDRFVLSNGHACALQYSMLHLTGYNLSMDDLKNFRQLGSKTPGHPENFVTDGVEVSTGPLGQGISNAVGMAIAERHLAATYNVGDEFKVFDNFTFVICGDGCLQEGVSSESSSLAGHLGLGKLIVLYDDNLITIDGSTDLSFSEDVAKRYEAYGWHVQTVSDVQSDLADLRSAVETAKAVTDKPSIIKIRTTIGYGSLNEGSASTHGAPLKPDDLVDTKKAYGLSKPDESFHVDDDVKEAYAKHTAELETHQQQWDTMFASYTKAHPAKAAELTRRFHHQLPANYADALPTFQEGTTAPAATRKSSQACLQSVAPLFTELIGGSADLTPSNLTALKCSGDFQRDTPQGRYMRFGVREHGMAAVCNGLFAYGGMRPFCATFLNFAGYALGAMRVSALSQFGIIYIMTHDSIGLGEDGPTHQPVEMLETLRAMPNINVFRPADLNEMNAAYQMALETPKTPSVICCSRGNVKAIPSSIPQAKKGAYILHETTTTDKEQKLQLILVSSGTEVTPCMEAAKTLVKDHGLKRVRVVSMPCQELFLQQSQEYQTSILPGDIPTLSVEASAVHGWHRFSHAQIGVTRFGLSAPGNALFEHFGFTPSNITTKAKALVEFYNSTNNVVPNLMSRPIFDNIQSKHLDH